MLTIEKQHGVISFTEKGKFTMAKAKKKTAKKKK